MWVFHDFGLVMPALVDNDLRSRPDWAEYSENGKYDFQVRGRIFEHLRHFQDEFMDEGTYHRDILSTPDHDYNYRFYTTQEAYAEALKRSAMAIDYRKFKPSSERYSWGRAYHSILNSIWSAVCHMNTPGDIWGPWSPENPKGYKSAGNYEWGSSYKTGRRIGDSFENIDFGDESDRDDIADEDWEWASNRIDSIVADMDELNIPMSEWPENLVRSEFEAVRPVLRKQFSKNVVRKMAKRNREYFQV